MKKLAALIFTFGLSVGLSLTALAANPVVEMKTNMGTITIELNQEKAPNSVENFLQYVKSGFYTNTIFHRVIEGFMIQGGGFEVGMKEKSTSSPIKNEANNGLKNERGTISMARTGNPHSATAQFFINVQNNAALNHVSPELNWGYAVFGKVTSGMDVVDKIKAVRTGNEGMFQNVPLEPVVIQSVKLVDTTKPETKTDMKPETKAEPKDAKVEAKATTKTETKSTTPAK